MKSAKKVEELDYMASSSMRWLNGEEVTAFVDYDSRWYYVWFEPTWNFEDFCHANDLDYMLSDLEEEIGKIGVNQFYDLGSVNEFCEQYCGDNEPSEFYFDEYMNVCGC